jgi:3-oxoacyl-(acyl-carrier-protein) synthase/malonyl CoA-acyl carrier protein transacylase/phosphopantetheinyl transferase
MTKDIAIIGMSAIFPGAPDLRTYWENIINKVDAIKEVPANRVDSRYFEGSVPAVDRFYCYKGGFIDDYAHFDPVAFGILPLAVEGMEPDQLLTLQLAYKALEDAGVWSKKYSLDNTSIIIGKGNYVGPGATRAVEIVHVSEQMIEVLRKLMPHLSEEELNAIKKEFQTKKGRFTPDTAMGLIPNLVASLVANRLNLGGAAYTVDAACASSLLAIDHAVNELQSGRADMAIAGGVHVAQNATFWSIFNQLGALSKKQQSRPFDEEADGLIIGEGCGFIVLKTLEKAQQDHDKIYCIIKGVGVSSDGSGTSVMSPSVKGQVKAIEQALKKAEISANDIGYIEAHGTATPLGDRTELETLKQVFGTYQGGLKAKIGSVKSMIGHAMPAAGIASIIKTALALYYDILPPTLHCDSPTETMKSTRFEPSLESITWSESGLPLVAGVNAFGFGGINAHVVLKAYSQKRRITSDLTPSLLPDDKLLLLARANVEELVRALETQDTTLGVGNYRIAIFNPTEDRIKKAINIVKKGKPWRNRQDIWFSSDPLLKEDGKIAFLFPGLDGLSSGETDSIVDYFGIEREFLTDDLGQETNVLSSALSQLHNSRVVDLALKKLGILPDLNAGHSMGEWLAGMSAGLVTTESVKTLVESLDPKFFEISDAQFVAVGCSYERISDLLNKIPDLYLANDNCPQQVILCGTYTAIQELTLELKNQQIFHQILPFQSGFHTPFIKDKVPQLLLGINKIEFLENKVAVWSATTLSPYPTNVEEIRALTVEHLMQPVRFRQLIEKLHKEEHVKIFLQIGSGGVIGFVDDTLKGEAYNAYAANSPHRSGLSQLKRVLALLYVEGKEVDLDFLGVSREQKVNTDLSLQLGSSLVTDWKFSVPSLAYADEKRQNRSVLVSAEQIKNPLAKAVAENMEEAIGMYSELITILEENSVRSGSSIVKEYRDVQKEGNVALSESQRISTPLSISLATHPYLIDHALVKQKEGWHCPDDMDPVIPMTMIFELFGEIAESYAEGKILTKIQDIRVFQWMNVSKPFKESVEVQWLNADKLSLNIKKYAELVAIVGTNRSISSMQSLDIGKPLDLSIDAKTIYERHMFHGPAYQGIKSVLNISDKGIKGIISGSEGKGSLLDNAGQLFGLWLQLTLPINRVAFPVKIDEITFHQDFHDQTGLFECTCMLTDLNNETATADFLLTRNGQAWASIRGWQNIRLEFDERLWQVSMAPKSNILSDEISPGVFKFHKAYQKVISWDFIAKRYLPLEDRNYLQEMPLNRRKKWLISRVAVRDAIRSLLLKEKNEAHFPIEFDLGSLPSGQPIVKGDNKENIHISIAHKNDEAVGIASLGKPVGIDIEEIKERGSGFDEIVLTQAEQLLLKGRLHDEWVTRFWVAKEAYGKYLGKGLQGNPKKYQVSAINGNDLFIGEIKIKTVKHNNYIIGWTL